MKESPLLVPTTCHVTNRGSQAVQTKGMRGFLPKGSFTWIWKPPACWNAYEEMQGIITSADGGNVLKEDS